MRIRKFSSGAGILVAFWLVAEVVMGFARNPVDDRWTGKVSVMNGATSTTLDATMTLDMLDSGFLVNKRPGIDGAAGARFVFAGNDVPTLQSLGINNDFLDSENRWQYKQGFCKMSSFKYEANGGSLNIQDFKVHKATFVFGTKDAGCPPFRMGIQDFDHIEFAVQRNEILGKGVIYARLERESRLSFIQRTIMRWRFNSWVDGHPTFAI